GAGHQPAPGELGQLPAELLHDLRAGFAAGSAGDLPDQLPSAGRPGTRAGGPGPRLPFRDPAAGGCPAGTTARHPGTGEPGGGVRAAVRAGRRAGGAGRRAAGHAGRAHSPGCPAARHWRLAAFAGTRPTQRIRPAWRRQRAARRAGLRAVQRPALSFRLRSGLAAAPVAAGAATAGRPADRHRRRAGYPPRPQCQPPAGAARRLSRQEGIMSRYRPPRTAGTPLITPEGEARLRTELHELWNVRRPQVTQAVSEAAALGDRSENAEYIYGKKMLREIDSRVRF